MSFGFIFCLWSREQWATGGLAELLTRLDQGEPPWK